MIKGLRIEGEENMGSKEMAARRFIDIMHLNGTGQVQVDQSQIL
jgi:hypothetical protein